MGSLYEVAKHISKVLHEHVVDIQRSFPSRWRSRGVAWSRSKWNLIRSAYLQLVRGEVCFKLLVVLCTTCELHVEIHKMFRGPTLLCHMIVAIILVASAFVVLIRFWLRNLFPLLEFITWLAGSIA